MASEKIPLLNQDRVQYSDKCTDDNYEYRHVILPKEFARYIPRTHLLSETEWRNLGIQQSPGWEHYMSHAPEPYILLFRRPLTAEAIAMKAAAPASISFNDSSVIDVTMDSIDNGDAGEKNHPQDETDENCAQDDYESEWVLLDK